MRDVKKLFDDGEKTRGVQMLREDFRDISKMTQRYRKITKNAFGEKMSNITASAQIECVRLGNFVRCDL